MLRTWRRSWRSAPSGPVVLVGHSYGGVVITNAAEGGGDVKALVYVNAFIPDVGENVFTILGGSGSALDVPDPTSVLDLGGYPGAPEGDVEAFLKASTVHDSFAQDLSEADRLLIAASQRPIALGANIAPTEAAAWKSIPSWAVIGTDDKVIPPDTQRSMAERAGSTITEVAASHVSMVSQPQVTIDAILAAVASIEDSAARRGVSLEFSALAFVDPRQSRDGAWRLMTLMSRSARMRRAWRSTR